MGSTAETAAARRKEKLELIELQVECGSLTIRTMTREERLLNPPRPGKPLRRPGDRGAQRKAAPAARVTPAPEG